MSSKLNPSNNNDNALPELADILQNIDTDAELADLNATTISDNNGGRIELDLESEVIKPISTSRDLNTQ